MSLQQVPNREEDADWRVFLAYSRDRMSAPAHALADALRRSGAQVIDPHDVETAKGEALRELATAIRASDLMIVLVSPGDETSRWMLFETRVMLETCWKRPEARIAVVAPAVGAIPSALRHRDFVTYYPHDEVRLGSWVEGAEASEFVSRLLQNVERPTEPPAMMTQEDLRRWRSRLVHLAEGGLEEEEHDLREREALLTQLRQEFGRWAELNGLRDEGSFEAQFEELLGRAVMAATFDDIELARSYLHLAEDRYEGARLTEETVGRDLGYRLARVAHRLGDPSTARDLLEDVFNEYAETLGDHHPATIATEVSLARAEQDLGNLRRAESAFRHALTASREALGNFHPQTADAAKGLGLIRLAEGDLDDALQLLRLAEAAYKRVRPKGSDEVREIRRYLRAISGRKPHG